MTKALVLSLLMHLFFTAALIWSAQFSAAFMRQKIEELNNVGVKKAEELYKPTEVNIRFGTQRKDLPPPKIKRVTKAPEDAPVYVQQKIPPKKTGPSKKEIEKQKKAEKQKQLTKKKSDALALIDQFRQDDGLEAKKKPKEDNFPMRLDGEKNAMGTGGSAELQATPAQLALQAAMREYFRLPQASLMRQKHPNATGYLAVSLIGVGAQLQVRSIKLVQTSGFATLDSSCENAVRRALKEEEFANDIVNELSGQETMVTCQF